MVYGTRSTSRRTPRPRDSGKTGSHSYGGSLLLKFPTGAALNRIEPPQMERDRQSAIDWMRARGMRLLTDERS